MRLKEIASINEDVCEDVTSPDIQSEKDDIKPELIRSKTPEKLLALFDPTPSEAVQKKIDYFFMPYSPK